MISAIRAPAVYLLQHVQLMALLAARERPVLQVLDRLAQILSSAAVSDSGPW
jgi:hypothetical protein